jgi:type II secretory pathway predicted ATPase ExeA
VVALMYEAFFGLQERPFDLTPDPRFLFMTAGHREALSTIQYGISGRKGITLLIGPAGTGKTTLVQAALRTQQGLRVKALHLANPTLTRNEFFEFLALELNLSNAAAQSKTHFLRELDTTLAQRQAAGVMTALLVDEAQAMSDTLLEEVRLLANSETSVDHRFPVVLIGQPELAVRLNERSMQQLKQRVALRALLAPLNLRETADYMAERIRISGGDIRTIFTQEAVAAIFGCSGGIPRTISVVCDNALVSGFALDQRPVGRSVITEVCRDFDLPVHAGAAVGTIGSHTGPVAALSAVPEAAAPVLILRPAGTVPRMRSTLGLRAIDNHVEAAPPEPAPRRGFRSLFARTASR